MSKSLNCKICHSACHKEFDAPILRRLEVPFYRCSNCGFLQCFNIDWLTEAYAQPINKSDTGYLSRNNTLAPRVATVLSSVFGKSAGSDARKFLDYAGGYGVFVRLMRDYGYNFYHSDLYTDNIFASTFDGDLNARYDAITAFEVLEHLEPNRIMYLCETFQ